MVSRTIPRDVVTFCAALAACDLRLGAVCNGVLLHGFFKLLKETLNNCFEI